jgi:ABC-type nitrate/sulfonate/bicarbonate transport system ATPase subunit
MLDGQKIHGQKGHIGYMPQQPSLFPWRTVEENVRLGQELSQQIDLQEIHSLIERAGLQGYEKRYPHECSGGMQQRIAFIRTLASGKEILCLDEPFGALDALTRTELQIWLQSILLQEKRTILFITHSIEEAILLSDRIYVLDKRPMKVKQELGVPFPRSERFSKRGEPEFSQLRQMIETALHSEVNC